MRRKENVNDFTNCKEREKKKMPKNLEIVRNENKRRCIRIHKF